MKPLVRLATPADLHHCERLDDEARSDTITARGAAAFFEQYPTSLRATDGFTLIAEVESTVVGFAVVGLADIGASRVATIERVFVTKQARRVGIGDALITATREQARARGCARLDALALPGDRDTKNLFERNGLTARLIVASTPL